MREKRSFKLCYGAYGWTYDKNIDKYRSAYTHLACSNSGLIIYGMPVRFAIVECKPKVI